MAVDQSMPITPTHCYNDGQNKANGAVPDVAQQNMVVKLSV